ncbi:MAG TPA: RloB family protein [Rugosimonospora sp.]|nr:RloB family protein [Rugosimonospora sp.]
MPRRESSDRRRPATRTPRPRILVVCGAAKTEDQYLRGLRQSVDDRAVDIQLKSRPRAPAQVVEHASRLNASDDFDEVWCVIDVDDFDIPSAVTAARRVGIELAVSNPCFELWLLLHHEDRRAYLQDYRAVLVRLRKYVPGYDKTELSFADFAGGVQAAIDRARALEPTGTDHQINPSTSMWRLAGKIIG